ncbi:MAG: tetratricopeptide repeat protein [Myxococcales bacterium]|nr:tetratricopeptide repeat protein [Myxococcales bacterium]
MPALMRELGLSEEKAREVYNATASVFPFIDEADQEGVHAVLAKGEAFCFGLSRHDVEGARRAVAVGQPLHISGDNKYKARNRAIQFEAAMRTGGADAALEFGERMLQLDLTDAAHPYQFGAALGQFGQFDRAMQHLWIAAQLAPDWDGLRVEVAVVLGYGERRKEALDHIECVVANVKQPTDFAWHTLGRLRWLNGKHREALDALERALALNPMHAYAVMDALWACEDLGDKPGVHRYTKRARELGIADPSAVG